MFFSFKDGSWKYTNMHIINTRYVGPFVRQKIAFTDLSDFGNPVIAGLGYIISLFDRFGGS